MQKSWLLRFPLFIVVATSGTSAPSYEVPLSIFNHNISPKRLASDNAVIFKAAEAEIGLEKLLEAVSDTSSVPVEREALQLQIPRPTTIPSRRKRQDDGQIQALSAQLQSLSQSATQAISSVSSSASSAMRQISQSAQSVQQSADQAVRSATQVADQANRQLSQTQSSASSALSAANSRASDQMSQSLASMSSRISVNQASAQSSASSAISSAQSVASQFAASQIQAVKAGATGVRDNLNSDTPVQQKAQPNMLSASTVAIIAVVSIVGTAILSTVSSCLFLRYRRKRRASHGEEETRATKEKPYKKPVAVRGSTSPRFPRFGRNSGSSIGSFRLPRLSPLVQSKKVQQGETTTNNNIGLADGNYGEQEMNVDQVSSDMDNKLSKAASMQPSAFRLQKNNFVSSATTVRLIRVGSEKSKATSDLDLQNAATTEPMPRPPLPVVTADEKPRHLSMSIPSESTSQSLSQVRSTTITHLPNSQGPPSRISVRSSRYTEDEMPGWRPPTLRSTISNQNRFQFRDSSDIDSAEPTPNAMGITLSLNTNPSSLRKSRPPRTNGNVGSRGPKNAGASFVTFPRVRNEPPRESMMDRGRPSFNSSSLGARLTMEEERRRKEMAGNNTNASAIPGGNRMSVRSSRGIFSDS